jgi:hypothetical protein
MKELARRAAEALSARLLAISGVATLFVSTWLSSFSQALSLDDTISLEEFLGSGHRAGVAMLARWDRLDVLWLAQIALISDLALFVPAYGVFFCMAARALGRELRCDAAAIDIASLLAPSDDTRGPGLLARISKLFSLDRLLLAFTVALVVADIVEGAAGLHVMTQRTSEYAEVMSRANGVKHALIYAVVGSFVALLLIWFFNFAHPNRWSRAPAPCDASATIRDRMRERAVLRRDTADVVWRSRYSLAAIAFFALIALLMDQGRDVLIGVALASGSADAPQLGVVAVSVLSVWLFAYACWLWPRVLCRIQKPSGPRGSDLPRKAPPAQATPAQPLLMSGERHGDAQWPPQPAPKAEERRPAAPASSHAVAKWWARFLGALPMLLLTWLSGLAAQAVYAAVPETGVAPLLIAKTGATGVLLLLCGAVSAGLGVTFFIMRSYAASSEGRRRQSDYYEALHERSARRELLKGEYKLLFFVPRATVTLIPIAFIGLLVIRWWSLASDGKPLALAAVALALALWSGVVGHISAHALRQGTPWVFFAILLVGVLGVAGFTENHLVPILDARHHGLSLIGMSIAAAAVGLILLLCWAGAVAWTRPSRRWKIYARLGWISVAAAGIVAVVYFASGRKDESTPAHAAAAESVPLDDALLGWLEQLCALQADCGAVATEAATPKPVQAYIVGTEGGGIRAAYWTALVLARLSAEQPDFARRTFSISGVSGGAIGAAVWRACWQQGLAGKSGASTADADRVQACVDQLGRADLLTPLASAWLFEDVLGRFIPSSWCSDPGCAFMSRGLWFERTLEARIGGAFDAAAGGLMTVPLNGWQGAAGTAAAHAPRLFLNSTVVESGERAIASDVRIEHTAFPNARDQQRELNAPLRLSTAAHNSARFPFVNAIGSLRPAGTDGCLYRVTSVAAGSAAQAAAAAQQTKQPLTCLHLADGGYFDNSGAQTNQDVVRALARLLDASTVAPLDEAQRTMLAWMRPRLQLTAVFIRNGVADTTKLRCAAKAQPGAPAASAVAAAASAPRYDPTELTCQGPLSLYTDLLGPIVTAKNSGGTGASGRLAESRLQSVIKDFNTRADIPEPARRADAPVVPIDLKRGEVLLPLGWYLSAQARDAMRRESQEVIKTTTLP